MSRDRRARREQPYLEQHDARAAQLARPPHTFGELLAWFLEGFWAETPERIHSRGVWSTTRRLDASARPTEDVPAAQQGGSALGAPRYAEPFRQLIENSPRQTVDEGGTVDPYFIRPMRAALARLARASEGLSAFRARFLEQVAYASGDWQSVASRWQLVPFPDAPVKAIDAHREQWTHESLRRLRTCWRAEPPMTITWIDRSEAQRTAEAENGNVA